MKKAKNKIFYLMCIICLNNSTFSQVTYGATASYSLRKLNTLYTGKLITVRRSADNATTDIGFNSCGDLDITSLKSFVLNTCPIGSAGIASAAAYGMRRLNCSYIGTCINVRRSSDNTTQDIGFTANGDLDTASLKTFVGITGSSYGYVTTWYDQSGNGRDLTQNLLANQPRIVNAGKIDRQNGLPSIRFIGANNMYLLLPQASLFTLADSYCIGSADVAGNTSNWWGTYRTTSNRAGASKALGNGAQGYIPGGFSLWEDWGGFAVDTVYVNQVNSVHTVTSRNNLTSAKLSQVSSHQKSPALAASYGSSGMTFGGDAQSSYGALTGYLSEVIFFPSALSMSNRQYIENNQAVYYNINGAALLHPLNGYIIKWYDQSGNGFDLTQAINANQPLIVNAGVVVQQGLLPTINLDGTSSYMTQSTANISNPYTANVIATRTASPGGGSVGYQRLLNLSLSGDSYGFLGAFNGNYATFTGNGSIWNDITANSPNTTVTLNAQSIMSMAAVVGGSGLSPFLNGTAQTGKNGTTANAIGYTVGAPYNGSNSSQLWGGNISEVNIFSTVLNITQRTVLETNQAAYYGISTSNNMYTPSSGYNLFVTGIGRTSPSDSIADSRQSVGMGFISGTSGADFLKDNGDYLTCGTTCLTSSVTTSLYMPTVATASYERWLNDWYINKTDINNNGGNIQLFFDFSDYGVSGLPSGTANNYQLWGRANTTSNFTVVPISNVAISGDRVVFTLSASNLGSTGYYTLGTTDYGGSPLPIELLYFKASQNQTTVDLNWETITETNNDYFTIEKSKDGINFEKVTNVKGAGNSITKRTYYEIDNIPYNGISYYRLKQTDFNGSGKYYPLQVVNFIPLKKTLIYPNPNINSTSINIELTGYENEAVLITVKDILGNEIFTKEILPKNNIDTFTLEEFHILSSGVYIITASCNNLNQNYKVIVK